MALGLALAQALVVGCVTAVDTTTQSVGQTGQGGSATTVTGTGISCTLDTSTGATLCNGTTSCPNILVDAVKFPNCGFRTLKPSFDLECICFGNYLCPVGTVSSCQAVSTLFSATTISEVCNGVSLNYCKQGTGSVAQGTGGAFSTCDQSCYSSCVGAPACVVACGC